VPGSGRGDIVPALLEPGEAVTRKRAVAYYGPTFFSALNRMEIPRDAFRGLLTGLRGFSLGGLVDALSSPLVPQAPLRFATGGLVAAPAAVAGSGTTVILHLDGRPHRLQTDEATGLSLLRLVRKADMTSAGRKPGF
jgi:hypothetical protein